MSQPQSNAAEEGEPEPSRQRELWTTIGIFAGATAVCAGFWQLGRVVAFVSQNLSALIGAVFLYLPTFLIGRERGKRGDYAAYGLTVAPLARGLLTYLVISAVVFPLFAVGMVLYYQQVCAAVGRGVALPRVYQSMCPSFAGGWSGLRWRLPKGFARMGLTEVIAVALPEEYFFRGYLQTRLERVWPSRRRLLGGKVGWSLVVTSLLFALGHVLVDFNGLRLAVFFPALVFGWLRDRTGSIVAGVLFHASSNLISRVLHKMFFR